VVLDDRSVEGAGGFLTVAPDGLGDADDALEKYELPTIAERLTALEQRHERLRQVAQEADRQVPAEIPDVTRRSLSYGDIEKRGELGRGGNADVSQATALTDGSDIALKEPRMGGGETLHTKTVERMMQEAETC